MARRRPEDQIQRAVVAHLKARAVPGLFWFSIPNGGYRSPIEARIMSGTGTRPGVPDLCFVHQGKSYFLEIKSPCGRPTAKQLECIAALDLAGAFTCVAEWLDRCLAVLKGWGLIRGKCT